jgi:hypothetical protein
MFGEIYGFGPLIRTWVDCSNAYAQRNELLLGKKSTQKAQAERNVRPLLHKAPCVGGYVPSYGVESQRHRDDGGADDGCTPDGLAGGHDDGVKLVTSHGAQEAALAAPIVILL